LGKYRLSGAKFAPFVEGGPSPRLTGNTNGYAPSHYGATVGAGVDATVGALRLAPTVRYTQWAKDQLAHGPPPWDYSQTATNQVVILFGFNS
jgi:hypothetical protein